MIPECMNNYLYLLILSFYTSLCTQYFPDISVTVK